MGGGGGERRRTWGIGCEAEGPEVALGIEGTSGHGSRSTLLSGVRHRLEVIPGEPLPGILEQLRGVLLKGRQVIERVDAVEPAGMNEAHEQVPDVSSMFGPEEE